MWLSCPDGGLKAVSSCQKEPALAPQAFLGVRAPGKVPGKDTETCLCLLVQFCRRLSCCLTHDRSELLSWQELPKSLGGAVSAPSASLAQGAVGLGPRLVAGIGALNEASQPKLQAGVL